MGKDPRSRFGLVGTAGRVGPLELSTCRSGSLGRSQPTTQEIEEAWAAYDRGEAGQAGIVDHVSFQVMRRLGISEAFTNDKHYQAAGFTVLF